MKKYTDSTLKRMTKGELIEMIRCFETNVEVLEEMNSNQFRILMEKEMYEWHDLRKNPEDLPKADEPVLIAIQNKNTNSIYYIASAHYKYFDELHLNEWHENTWDALAWKYIEPFEEDNK